MELIVAFGISRVLERALIISNFFDSVVSSLISGVQCRVGNSENRSCADLSLLARSQEVELQNIAHHRNRTTCPESKYDITELSA